MNVNGGVGTVNTDESVNSFTPLISNLVVGNQRETRKMENKNDDSIELVRFKQSSSTSDCDVTDEAGCDVTNVVDCDVIKAAQVDSEHVTDNERVNDDGSSLCSVDVQDTQPSSPESKNDKVLQKTTQTSSLSDSFNDDVASSTHRPPSKSHTCESCGQLMRQPTTTTQSDNSICTAIQSTSVDACRICHCEMDNELGPLIAPCKCKGTLEFVHQSCLQQWIKSSDYKHCELCGFHFAMDSKLKPITKWEKLTMSTSERRKIICSVMFHVIAITCVVWSLYVLIERTAAELKSGDLNWPFWTKLVVVAIGFTGGLVFMYVQCKVYVQLWRRLKAFNRIIYVQDQPPKTDAIKTTALTDNDNNEHRNNITTSSNVDVIVEMCDHPTTRVQQNAV